MIKIDFFRAKDDWMIRLEYDSSVYNPAGSDSGFLFLKFGDLIEALSKTEIPKILVEKLKRRLDYERSQKHTNNASERGR